MDMNLDGISKETGMNLGCTHPAMLRCVQHGKYEGYKTKMGSRIIESICPDCLEIQRVREQRELHQKMIMNCRSEILSRSCIPTRYKKKDFNSYQPVNETAAACKRYLQDYALQFEKACEHGTSFLLSGQPGSGKTHLACSVATHIMKVGRTAIYSSLVDCFSRVKAGWAMSSDKTEDQIIEEFSRFDLLIIDEIGVATMKAADPEIAFRIINRRYEEGRPTIGISKHPRAKVINLIGEECVSRLESGGGGTLLFTWADYRTRNSINR